MLKVSRLKLPVIWLLVSRSEERRVGKECRGGRTACIFRNQPHSGLAGAIESEAADEIGRFIELCNAYSIPLVSLIDSPVFFFKQQTAYEVGLGIPAEPLFRSRHSC